jgi:hypothetical protein
LLSSSRSRHTLSTLTDCEVPRPSGSEVQSYQGGLEKTVSIVPSGTLEISRWRSGAKPPERGRPMGSPRQGQRTSNAIPRPCRALPFNPCIAVVSLTAFAAPPANLSHASSMQATATRLVKSQSPATIVLLAAFGRYPESIAPCCLHGDSSAPEFP